MVSVSFYESCVQLLLLAYILVQKNQCNTISDSIKLKTILTNDTSCLQASISPGPLAAFFVICYYYNTIKPWFRNLQIHHKMYYKLTLTFLLLCMLRFLTGFYETINKIHSFIFQISGRVLEKCSNWRKKKSVRRSKLYNHGYKRTRINIKFDINK